MSSSTPASHGELPFDHAAAGLAVFGGCSALLSCLEQQKREQCRERVCERSDGKPLDTAELSAPASELDTDILAVKVRLTHSKTNFQATVE